MYIEVDKHFIKESGMWIDPHIVCVRKIGRCLTKWLNTTILDISDYQPLISILIYS